ncbi:MAG: hypothetical protein R6U70_01480 [Bacillota bacterium]
MDLKWIIIGLAAVLVVAVIIATPLAALVGLRILPGLWQAGPGAIPHFERVMFGSAPNSVIIYLIGRLFRFALYGGIAVLAVLILRDTSRRRSAEPEPPADEAARLRAEIDRLQRRLDQLEPQPGGEGQEHGELDDRA